MATTRDPLLAFLRCSRAPSMTMVPAMATPLSFSELSEDRVNRTRIDYALHDFQVRIAATGIEGTCAVIRDHLEPKISGDRLHQRLASSSSREKHSAKLNRLKRSIPS